MYGTSQRQKFITRESRSNGKRLLATGTQLVDARAYVRNNHVPLQDWILSQDAATRL